MEQLAKYIEWFEGYANEFIARHPGGEANYVLKLEHTRRVLGHAGALAESLDLEPKTAFWARLSALMHDVGRFPQLERFGTFHDARSIDHGWLGARTLMISGVLAGLPPMERKVVVSAVSFHNRGAVPRRAHGPVRLVTRLVRDADKMDIIPVLAGRFTPGAQPDPDVTLGLEDDDGAYTPAVLEDVLSRRQARYVDLVTVRDLKIFVLGWVYDLNFPHAARHIQRQGHLAAIAASLDGPGEFGQLARQVLDDLDALARG